MPATCEPFFEGGRVSLYQGDCLEVMRSLPDASVDSVVTDPPYGISFMGKKWDVSVPSVATWAECLRVLKPGGHLLAFAGTRTQHRMAVSIEDAGFEIRDMIAWVHGQGFPKGKNLGEPWEGWGTALKPALEPITMARKPLKGAVEQNVLAYGTGAINIDSSRVEPTGESRERVGELSQDTRYTESGGTNFAAKPGIRGGSPTGRWPANLIHDGSDEVNGLFPVTTSGAMRRTVEAYDGESVTGFLRGRSGPHNQHGGSGNASRFFYCAKATNRERGEGNKHPTVKPVALMEYLCRLVTPPGGVILDPFFGTGTTGKAAIPLGFWVIGIEVDPGYCEIAVRRLSGDAADPSGKAAS